MTLSKKKKTKNARRTRKKRTSIASAGGEAEETHPVAESLGASFRHFSLKHRKMDVNDMGRFGIRERRRRFETKESAETKFIGGGRTERASARDTGYFYATHNRHTWSAIRSHRRYWIDVHFVVLPRYRARALPTRDQLRRTTRRNRLVRTRVVWVWGVLLAAVERRDCAITTRSFPRILRSADTS